MRVLLLGATGNLGSRLLPALQAHGHQVVAIVRSKSKLDSLIPESILAKTTVIIGDAANPETIRSALVANKCEAMINSAGQAAIFPWQEPKMQDIERATVEAAADAGKELSRPIQGWWLNEMIMLDYPGMPEIMLS